MLCIYRSTAQPRDVCLQTNNNDGLPIFQGYTGDAARPPKRIPHQHQAIIPSYQLSCCGNITAWGVDLSPAETNVTFDFDFQVWRPSPTVDETGCYSLVGNYIVQSTSIALQPESEHVARVTPLPQDQLQFQPGDVLGFYVESQGTDSNTDNGVVLLDSANYTSELAWHASITALTSQSGSCPYPVGPNGVLRTATRAAPVISISVTTYSCSFTTNSAVVPTYSRPSMITTASESNEPLISSYVVIGIAVPFVTIFGFINLITIVVVIMLYVKIKRLHKTVDSVSANEYCRANKLIPPPKEDTYDTPDAYSFDLIRPKQNIAYATMERGKN